ncbi:hypothetical protein RQP46_001725 [Phenoliferia psychrophenolica]
MALPTTLKVLAWHSPIFGDEIDPYLEAQPDFVYAMPVQVVVLGICVTLLSVLLVHLLFTVRYHFPLSKLNYCCQISAVILTLARTIAELRVLMIILMRQPQTWPYEFLYIEVTLPPATWNRGALAAWLLIQALSILVLHATHIQFLTMLFPSALEARLILGFLGPLAIVSSFLVFTDLSGVPAVGDLGDAIRNTANSTLTLLYTLAIFIWGLTLNRSRAWRTDGGTAAFGIIALILGVTGTAVNFLEVKEDRMRWLPDVISCILLWQSWMGFWWWVGAGMWTGEAEDVNRKEERARRKEEKKRKRREAAFIGNAAAGASTSRLNVTAGGGEPGSSTTRRRSRAGADPPPEEFEMNDLGPSRRGSAPPRPPVAHSDESVSSGSTPPPMPHILDPIVQLFRPFLARLRLAHDEAVVNTAALPPGLPDDVKQDLEREIGAEDPDWRGRGMDGEASWTWRGAIKRWRLKDVQHY